MSLIRTFRALPVLVVAMVALFVASSASALAASTSHHSGPVASAAHKKAKKHKKKKASKKKAPKKQPKPAQPKPAQPKGPFVAKDAGATGIGTGPDDTIVETLSLPVGSSYIVTAKAELGNNGASANTVSCKLLENNNPLDSGNEALAPLATFQHTITLTSASSGGSIKLACSGEKGAQARNRVITAVRSS